MQTKYFLIIFAITLTCAYSKYDPTNFAKMPVSVKNETSFKAGWYNGFLNLQSLAPGDISITRTRYIKDFETNFTSWVFWRRTIDPNNLSIVSDANYSFPGGPNVLFYNGYAVEFINEATETGGSRIMVKQTRLEGNVTLPTFSLTDSKFVNQTAMLANLTYGDTVYVCVDVADALNITSFKLGSSFVEKTITYSTLSKSLVQMAKGGALSKDQVFVTTVSGYYYELIVDFSSGTIKSNKVNGYSRGLGCKPYVTNSSFGSTCSTYNIKNSVYYQVEYATSNFSQLQFLFTAPGQLIEMYVYGSYLAALMVDPRDLGAMYYQLWNPATMQNVTDKIPYISGVPRYVDPQDFFHSMTRQAPDSSIYVLLYNMASGFVEDVTSLRVGMLLDNSFAANKTSSDFEVNEDDNTMLQYFLA